MHSHHCVQCIHGFVCVFVYSVFTSLCTVYSRLCLCVCVQCIHIFVYSVFTALSVCLCTVYSHLCLCDCSQCYHSLLCVIVYSVFTSLSVWLCTVYSRLCLCVCRWGGTLSPGGTPRCQRAPGGGHHPGVSDQRETRALCHMVSDRTPQTTHHMHNTQCWNVKYRTSYNDI